MAYHSCDRIDIRRYDLFGVKLERHSRALFYVRAFLFPTAHLHGLTRSPHSHSSRFQDSPRVVPRY